METMVPVPDIGAAVGPEHFVELLNGRWAVYDKETGLPIASSSHIDFWEQAGIAGPIHQASDPRVLFDAATERVRRDGAPGGTGTARGEAVVALPKASSGCSRSASSTRSTRSTTSASIGPGGSPFPLANRRRPVRSIALAAPGHREHVGQTLPAALYRRWTRERGGNSGPRERPRDVSWMQARSSVGMEPACRRGPCPACHREPAAAGTPTRRRRAT